MIDNAEATEIEKFVYRSGATNALWFNSQEWIKNGIFEFGFAKNQRTDMSQAAIFSILGMGQFLIDHDGLIYYVQKASNHGDLSLYQTFTYFNRSGLRYKDVFPTSDPIFITTFRRRRLTRELVDLKNNIIQARPHMPNWAIEYNLMAMFS